MEGRVDLLLEGIRNNTVTSAGFDDSNLKGAGCLRLAEALRHNTSLQTLSLFRCGIEPEGAAAIAEALYSHPRVDYLTFYVNNLGDEGAIAVARLLQVNRSLRVVNIDGHGQGNHCVLPGACIQRDTTLAAHLFKSVQRCGCRRAGGDTPLQRVTEVHRLTI
jgi:hypothetical protein